MNIDPTLHKDLRAGVVNPAELERWLLTNVPVPQLVHELAEYMQEARINKPIVMSIEEFQAHFRLRGYRFQDDTIIKEVEKVL